MSLQQLAPQLKQLRLSGILDGLEVRTEQAVSEQWSHLEFLTRLLQDEVERRNQKQLALRVRRGGLLAGKTLTSFDFGFNPAINRQLVHELATCAFVRQHRNVLLCGQTGVGKSHLAGAHQMLLHLNAGRADGSYERRLAGYVKPALLVLDDFGLKPLPPSGSADLYDVLDQRYETGSILLTSNRAPEEWPEVFNDPLLASAGLDRLGDRAYLLTITGRSFRLSHQQRAAQGSPVEASPPPSVT
jgi:DNA replication protein DnaC